MRSLLLFALPLILLCHSHAADWYVAPNGNDAWSGTLPAPNAEKTDGPFATLAKARDVVRAAKGARTVHIREGSYQLPEGIKFDGRDSGTADAPVTWQSFEKEKPVLIGGRAVKGWQPWNDGIYQADLSAQGLKGAAFKQLIFAGERQILARYPNYDPKNPYGGGWAYVDGVMWPMYSDIEGEVKNTLKVKEQDWRQWAKPEEVEVFIFPRYNWWNDILRVKAIDPATRTITTARNASYAMRANDRYYFQNALEELDAPGEWYLDRENAILYFKPPKPLETAEVYAPTTRDILQLEGTSHVVVRGLTFECADGTAINLVNANDCRVIACTVRNIGDFSGTGISVNGTSNGVIGCDVSFTGRNGISLSGGDRQTLTGAGNFVENCYIHHTGVYYKQGVGVSLDGVGQRVSHCLIHDTPRFGVIFSGNSHILEYNHMRHLALETEDVGATYSGGRDWISPRGTIIRHNYIHDVLGYGWNGKWVSPYFAWGIYLDDNSGGVDVIGNIVVRCGRSLIHGHSARDCRVENNIFIEGGQRQWEFNGWTTQHRFWTSHFERMVKGYESVVNEPAWQFLRGMHIHPSDIADQEGRVMSGNVFQRNIMAWKNPEAKALNVVAFNRDRNVFDRNLYWHYGQPLKTGIRITGKPIGGNLTPNPGFEKGELDKLPADWSWQIRTPTTSGGLVEEEGRRVLRINAAFNEAKQRDNYPIITSREIELKPGGSYRLRARMRTDREEAKAAFMVQYYHGPKDGQSAHFWASSQSPVKISRDWQDFEVAFNIPAPGERGSHPRMKMFRVRVDWPEKAGALFVDDVVLEETEQMDEWESWKQTGGDGNSIVADPKFLDPDKDDYRLAPDSPAWALGFKPIPVEEIGPYESPDRATWPIVEAPGARENPLSPE